MAKLRKTRAQKVATAEKRNQYTYSFTPHVSHESVKHTPVHTSHMVTTSYVKHDLLKTIFTSLFLITAQIVLLFLLQHHVVKIPGATY
jgi:hypothetical protein